MVLKNFYCYEREDFMRTYGKAFSLLLLCSVLPGCFNKEEKKVDQAGVAVVRDGDRVLIEVAGDAALTEKEFEDLLAQAAEDPQIKFMLEFMPEVTREQLFKAKERAVVISAWAKAEGVRESEEYKKKLDTIIKSLHEALDNENFLLKHKVEVSDSEAKRFYEEQKGKDPRLTISPAGVKAVGVVFDTKDAAQKFKNDVGAKARDLEKIAQTQKLQVRDFGVVNQDTMNVDAAVKGAILDVKSVPSVNVVNDGKKFWVIASLAKEQAAYHPFDDVKEGIKRLLMPKKMEEMYEAELPKHKQRLKVVENKDYLKELEQRRTQREQEMQQKQQEAQAAEGKELSTAKPAAM